MAATSETPTVAWEIEQAEYDARVGRVRQALQERGLDGLVLFHPARMAYLTGFFHAQTERPMAVVVSLTQPSELHDRTASRAQDDPFDVLSVSLDAVAAGQPRGCRCVPRFAKRSPRG